MCVSPPRQDADVDIKTMDDKDRYRTVAFCATLVSLGLIGMDEFVSVMVGIDGAFIEEDFVSTAFLLRLTDYYCMINKRVSR